MEVGGEPKPGFPVYVKDGGLIFAHGELLQIEENRLARQLALKIAYRRAAEGIIFDVSGQTEFANTLDPEEEEIAFPFDVFYNAVRAMESAEFLRRENLGFYRITLKGQLKYEEGASFQDKAFIIASCNKKMKPIVKMYKDILAEPQFNLDGIFQEDEEPEKSIHIDIFDYIQNVRLIIADLTGHRRNCYLELGYAMALNKRIILALNEEDHYDPKTGKELLAFDTTPMKYTFYKDMKELGEKIRERIAVNLEMIRKAAEI